MLRESNEAYSMVKGLSIGAAFVVVTVVLFVVLGIEVTLLPASPSTIFVLPQGTVLRFRLYSQPGYMVRYTISRGGRLVGSWSADGGLQVLALPWSSDTPPAVSFPTPPWPRNGTLNQTVSPGENAVVFYPALDTQPYVNLTITQAIMVVYN